MNYGKKDAVRISWTLGCALLFSMILQILFGLLSENAAARGTGYMLLVRTVPLAVFVLPAVWGVSKLRRSEISLPMEPRAHLNKRLAVMLSTFGVIVIVRILYASVFPSAVIRAGVNDGMTATALFLMFLFSTVIPAVSEEIFFRGFFMRCMRIFRPSLAVLMSALAFALMSFSVEGFPLYFVTGLLIAMAYTATGSLSVVIGISFLYKAFEFLEETVDVCMPDSYMLLMRGGLAVCVLLSASGLPYLKENMRAFFENDDENAIPSSYFWTIPTILFVALAAGIQLLFQTN